MKAAELGFKLEPDAPETRAITEEVKRLEGEGYEYEAAEGSLALLISKSLKHQDAPFKIDGYHVSVRRDRSISVCQASVKVQVDGVSEHTIAEGDGPVNALDGALRRALIKFFPQLKRVLLQDYKVRILDSAAGTGARTRVLIESTDGKAEYPKTRAVGPQDVLATMYHVLDIDYRHVFYDAAQRPIPILNEGKPIAELI